MILSWADLRSMAQVTWFHTKQLDTWYHYNGLNLGKATEGLKEVHKVLICSLKALSWRVRWHASQSMLHLPTRTHTGPLFLQHCGDSKHSIIWITIILSSKFISKPTTFGNNFPVPILDWYSAITSLIPVGIASVKKFDLASIQIQSLTLLLLQGED